MKSIIIFLPLLGIILILIGALFFSRINKKPRITNFNECAAAGNPVMESYPRQCREDGKTFTEIIKKQEAPKQNPLMTEPEARTIAEKICIKGGEALEKGDYNENSKTWWFNAKLNSTKPGCNPACVVFEVTKTAEINWRCTGHNP